MLALVTNIHRDGDPADPGDSTPYVKALYSEGTDATGKPIVSELRAPYGGEPPPLMCFSEFDSPDGLNWRCAGTHDVYVDEVLNEDFTRVPTTAAGTTTIACDTPWRCTIGTGGSIVQGSDALGSTWLATGAAIGRTTLMEKDDTAFSLSSADAYWLNTRVGLGATTSISVLAGLINDAGSVRAAVGYDASFNANWYVGTTADGVSFTSTPSATAAGSGYVDVDLILVQGSFLAGWFNGDGPTVVTTNVPTTSGQPYLWVQAAAAASKILAVDAFTITALNGTIANPATDPLLTSS